MLQAAQVVETEVKGLDADLKEKQIEITVFIDPTNPQLGKETFKIDRSLCNQSAYLSSALLGKTTTTNEPIVIEDKMTSAHNFKKIIDYAKLQKAPLPKTRSIVSSSIEDNLNDADDSKFVHGMSVMDAMDLGFDANFAGMSRLVDTTLQVMGTQLCEKNWAHIKHEMGWVEFDDPTPQEKEELQKKFPEWFSWLYPPTTTTTEHKEGRKLDEPNDPAPKKEPRLT